MLEMKIDFSFFKSLFMDFVHETEVRENIVHGHTLVLDTGVYVNSYNFVSNIHSNKESS